MNRIVIVTILEIFLFTGCSKKPKETVPDSAPPPPPATTSGGPSSGGLAGGRINGGGGGGGVFAGYKAARRTEALNEMRTLGQLISLLQNDLGGRMPTKDQIMAEVMKTDRKLFTAINEGAFILTGTTEAGGLWAYEVDADKIPGIALIGGTATRSTPEDLKQYFQRN